MQKVGIVTDTVAQLTQEAINEYQIKVVPAATIYCDGKVFIDGVDITPAAAYGLLAQNPHKFTTAAISAEYYREVFEELSYITKQILCITISSKLSSGYHTALMASKQITERMPDIKIHIMDSLNAGGGEGLIVLTAAKATVLGLELEAVITLAEKARQASECLFVFDTLRHAYRTGRVPRIVSQTANILSVKPLCRIYRDGKVHFVGLARSREKGIQRMLKMAQDRIGDIPINVMVMHTTALPDAEKLRERVKTEFNCREVFLSEFSPVMGYGAGPGVLGIAFCPDFEIERGK